MAKARQNSPSFDSYKNEMVDLIIRQKKEIVSLIEVGAGYGTEEQLKCVIMIISSREDLMSKDTGYIAPSVRDSFEIIVSAAAVILGAAYLTLGVIEYPKSSEIGSILMREGNYYAMAGLVVAALIDTRCVGASEAIFGSVIVSVSAASLSFSGDVVLGVVMATAGALVTAGAAAYHIYDTHFITHENIKNVKIETADKIFDDASSFCAIELGGVDYT